MARTYNKPPLIEAVCDFRFSSSQPWDWTIPGLFYEQIRERFPIKEQLNAIETVVDPNQGRFVQQTQPKLQFASEARDEVIQIGPNNLSIHQLPLMMVGYTLKNASWNTCKLILMQPILLV